MVYGFIMVPLFLAVAGVVVWQRRREQRIVIEQLPGFAQAGWIAPSEVPLLSSLAGRRGWRAAVRRGSGRHVEKAVSQYQYAVTELAFLRSKMARGAVGDSGMYWHEEALDKLRRARARAVGHPEGLTVAMRHRGQPQLDAAAARTAADGVDTARRPAPELAAPAPTDRRAAPAPVKPATAPLRRRAAA